MIKHKALMIDKGIVFMIVLFVLITSFVIYYSPILLTKGNNLTDYKLRHLNKEKNKEKKAKISKHKEKILFVGDLLVRDWMKRDKKYFKDKLTLITSADSKNNFFYDFNKIIKKDVKFIVVVFDIFMENEKMKEVINSIINSQGDGHLKKKKVIVCSLLPPKKSFFKKKKEKQLEKEIKRLNKLFRNFSFTVLGRYVNIFRKLKDSKFFLNRLYDDGKGFCSLEAYKIMEYLISKKLYKVIL